MGLREQPIAFLPNGREVATLVPLGGSGAATISTYDAATGERIRRFASPRVYFYGEDNLSQNVQRHGLLLANSKPTPDNEGDVSGLHSLDLKSGEWRRIAEGPASWALLHESRPWVLFCERHQPGYTSRRIVVYDFAAKKEIFAMHSPIFGSRIAFAFFISESDRLVLTLTDDGDRHPSKVRFAIWSLDWQAKPERTVDAEFGADWYPSPSFTGRVAFGLPAHGNPLLSVVDLTDGALVAKFPGTKLNDQSSSATASPPCTLSLNGKTVLGGKPATLWEVDSKRLLWRGRDHELAYVDAVGGEFAVVENWFWRLPRWLRVDSLRHLDTVSWRAMDTGSVLRRTWTSELLASNLLSKDRTLGITLNGVVHRTEVFVNWALLAACQAVLALPLVVPWAIVRWRRRSKQTRLAPAI